MVWKEDTGKDSYCHYEKFITRQINRPEAARMILPKNGNPNNNFKAIRVG